MMLGFALPDNFRYPYGSIGFSELWQRWHISLASWLRDYLYIPLGGNKISVSRTYVNLMLTMLLGGLWHGASRTFVVWGFLHGTYLVIQRLSRQRIKLMVTNQLTRVALALLTFTCVNITWVFCRAESFSDAGQILLSMSLIGAGIKQLLASSQLVLVLVLMTLVFTGHFAMRRHSLVGIIEKVLY